MADDNIHVVGARSAQEADGLRAFVRNDCKPYPRLGDRVRIREAGDITGIVTEHTCFLDGSERWSVDYWHDGSRREIRCEAGELEVI